MEDSDSEDSEPWSVPSTTSEPLSTAGVRRKLHAEGYRVGVMSGVDEVVRIPFMFPIKTQILIDTVNVN